jgi:hypothetical protein
VDRRSVFGTLSAIAGAFTVWSAASEPGGLPGPASRCTAGKTNGTVGSSGALDG